MLNGSFLLTNSTSNSGPTLEPPMPIQTKFFIFSLALRAVRKVSILSFSIDTKSKSSFLDDCLYIVCETPLCSEGFKYFPLSNSEKLSLRSNFSGIVSNQLKSFSVINCLEKSKLR